MLKHEITDADFIDVDDASVEAKPDPRDLYRSQVFGQKMVQTMAKFAGPGGVLDTDKAIDLMLGLAVRDIPTVQGRCAEPEARAFIFRYVHYFMQDDMFVARARVSMLEHIIAQTNPQVSPQSFVEHALARNGGDRLVKDVAILCNTSDHYAMRLQLIRAFVNEAVIRVLAGDMTINDPTA